MSTPAGELNLSGILEPTAPPLVRPSLRRPARRPQPTPGLNLSGVLEPARAAPSASASQRHSHGAYDSLTEGSWSIGDAPKVKDWYRQTFNTDLPVSAFGQSPTHDRMRLDHSQSMDVRLSPTSREGAALVSYLKQNRVPYLAYDRAVPGAATGPHIHVGSPSHGLGGQPSSPSLNLDGILDPLNLDGILESSADDYGEPVRTEAAVDRATGRPLALSDRRRQVPVDASTVQPPATSMAALPQRQTFDPRTEARRAARDERAAFEASPGARTRIDVPLSATGYDDWSRVSGNELARAALRIYAEGRSIPHEFVVSFLQRNGDKLKTYDLVTGAPREPIDMIGGESYDAARRTMRVSQELPLFRQLEDEYRASRGLPARISDWATDSERSPGEKFLDVVTPTAQFAVEKSSRALDLATRPLQAIDAGFWAKVRGADNVQAVKAAYDQFFGDQPELGKNVIAEALRHSDRLRAINPRLPSLLGELVNIVVEPSNLIPVGAVAKGAKLLRGAEGAAELGRFGRLMEGARGAAREAGLLDRGLVEARPLGLLGEAETGLKRAVVAEPSSSVSGAVEGVSAGAPVPDLHHSNYQPRASTGQFIDGKPQPSAPTVSPPIQFTVDDALHQRSPYYDLDPQEVLSAALEGQRARLTELRRLEAAAARGVDPKTGAELSPRALRRLQGQVEGLKADVASGPALVRESFGDEAAKAFERHASEGLPTEFTFDPRAGERGAVNVSEIAAGARKAASKETLLDLANVPRTLKASADVSAPLRQGAIFTLTEPRAATRGMGAQLRAFVSEGNFEQAARDIAFHPDADLARKSGLYFATQEAAQPLARGVARPLAAREEAFMSRIAGNLPLVRHSERAYTTYLDKLRMEVFSKYADEIRSAAATAGREVDPKELRDIADFINKATGRGNIGDWGKTGAPVLNATFFAPRYVASRFQILNPATYMRMSPVARRIAMRKMVQFAGTVGATMLLMKGAGADVDLLHPDSPDWLKVKFGNTRYDLTGGVRTEMRFIARFGSAVRRGLAGEKLGRTESPDYIFQRYLRSKLAPIPSVGWDAATGKTFTGEQFSWGRAGRDMVTPLMLTDLYDAYQVEGVPGAIKTLPSAFGVGVQTYQGRGERGEPSEPGPGSRQ